MSMLLSHRHYLTEQENNVKSKSPIHPTTKAVGFLGRFYKIAGVALDEFEEYQLLRANAKVIADGALGN